VSEIACPSCGVANPADNRFCGSCGALLNPVCAACGSENPAGNRFCGTCGSPLGETASTRPVAVEERKVVTVLFADLTASTEMASRLDPEDLRGVLRQFFDAMVSEIDRYGGTVEKFIGDAVVAVFGAPVVHEDDPERAVRCALAMQRRLPELNEHLASKAGGDLAMRIGLNTGEVVTHAVEEGIVTGRAVNIAARFQTVAAPGRVVVGERTYRQTRGAFAFTNLGELTVKGIDRPLRVWQADGEIASPRSATPMLETPFVGRSSEKDLLRLLFERTVAEGRPNLVTVVGPPGIGKSRLSHEVAVMLGGEGIRVLRGRCLPYGDGLTYWPLAEILKADAGILDSDPPEVTLAKASSRLNPRFSGEDGMGITAILLSSIGIEVPSDPLAGTDPQVARRVIARAWQRYLESMAGEGPVLALIEDIHWADPNLLELIEAVASRASGPALLLCMARPDLFERRSDWGGGLSNATTISLSPLSAGDGAALLSHLLDGGAPTEVVDAILLRSEGNPFFAAELLRMMIEDGTLARREGRWALVRELPSALPDTVQGVIASRLDLLPAAEKTAIQDASVVGRAFWPGAVERLGAGRPDTAIDGLIAKGLVREREASTIAGERELIFNHILTRDVAYASIPRARRAEAHGAVGLWVEEVTRGRDEEFAEILAFHFELGGDDGRTARYALLAGNRHLRVFAAEEAIEWYDRAIDAKKDDAQVEGRIRLARGAALEQIGRFADALADYEESFGRASEVGDAELEARALAAQAHVLWLLDRYDEAEEHLPLALERARAVGLADVEARLLYTAGTIRFGQGTFADVVPFHERALAVATASGDLEGQALAHHGLCETYTFGGPVSEQLRHGLRADELLRDLGQRAMVAHNAYMLAWGHAFLGRPDEAYALADASIATSHEIGNGRDEAFALFARSWVLHLAAMRLGEAWVDVSRGLELFRDLGLLRGRLAGFIFRADVCAEAADLSGLAEDVDAALRVSDELGGAFLRPTCLALRGWVALTMGEDQEAERWFDEARPFDELLNVVSTGRTEILAAEWASDPARLDRAASRLEGTEADESPLWGVWAPYARGLAALLREAPTDAARHALAAHELAAGIGERRVRWRAACVAWKALDALGRTDEAERYRADAAGIVRDAADGLSGPLQEAFTSRPDVTELLA
jgi:class 3 adenylate cyclase/tetratricopeptide (TPR) repeat protein